MHDPLSSALAAVAGGVAAVGEAQQLGHVEDLDPAAGDGDDAVVLQAAEAAADGLQREAEETRDVLAAHRQLELAVGLADVAVTLAQACLLYTSRCV